MTAHDESPPPFDPLDAVRWGQRLAHELVRLPDSIAQWREGVALLVTAARRLEAVTAAAEQLVEQIDASGVPQRLERLNRLGQELTREATTGGVAVGEQMLNETRRNVAALARLLTPPPTESQD